MNFLEQRFDKSLAPSSSVLVRAIVSKEVRIREMNDVLTRALCAFSGFLVPGEKRNLT